MKYIIFLIAYLIYYLIKSKKTLQFLQQNRYNRGNKYLKYINSHLKNTFLNAEVIFIPLIIITILIKIKELYIFAGFYILMSICKLYAYKNEQKKLPLVYTKRIIRLYVTLFIIYGGLSYLGYLFLFEDHFYLYIILSFIFILVNNCYFI